MNSYHKYLQKSSVGENNGPNVAKAHSSHWLKLHGQETLGFIREFAKLIPGNLAKNHLPLHKKATELLWETTNENFSMKRIRSNCNQKVFFAVESCWRFYNLRTLTCGEKSVQNNNNNRAAVSCE